MLQAMQKKLPLIQFVVLASILLAPMAAIADRSADAPAAKPSPVIKAKAIKGALRTSKTSMGARVDYVVEAPAAGQTTSVRLKIEGREIGRPLSIEVAASNGLQLVRGLPGGRAEQTDVAVEYILAINPPADGLYYLSVFFRSGDMTEAMAIAIPVGKAPVISKPVTPQTTPDGRRILSIPAQQ